MGLFFVNVVGMVQICSSCNEKHIHRAEVGPIASSVGGGSNGSGGRYTPSDNKSQANSEASNVRFKVRIRYKIQMRFNLPHSI